jgi:hypothetical protein
VAKTFRNRTCEFLHPQHAPAVQRQMLCTGECGGCDVLNPNVQPLGERANPIPLDFQPDSARYGKAYVR